MPLIAKFVELSTVELASRGDLWDTVDKEALDRNAVRTDLETAL